MFPLTQYLCALIDVAEGRTTIDAVRARWKAGEFKGVRDDWAVEYAKRITPTPNAGRVGYTAAHERMKHG